MAKRKKEETPAMAEPPDVKSMSKVQLLEEVSRLTTVHSAMSRKELEKEVIRLREENPKLVEEMLGERTGETEGTVASEGE